MNLAAWFSASNLDLELCGRLCLVLAHSLWQFALLAVIATVVARVWTNATPEKVYAIYAGALLVGLASLPITFALTRLPGEANALGEVATVPQQTFSPAPNPVPGKQMPRQQAAPPHFMADVPPESPTATHVSHVEATSTLLAWTPWVVAGYAVGVTIMLLRLLRGLWQNYRLSARAQAVVAGPLFETLQALARSWSLQVTPALGLAERVIVPQVVGLWRPTILLPAAALTGLRPDELEMILAHELTHVRRYDLWANLVQRLAEAVLFFNPAVWYLSRRISMYREYCCDEATCRLARRNANETRVRYAEALVRAVELTQGDCESQKFAALAASGSRPSELRRRVARLFGEPLREPLRISRTGFVAMLVGVAALVMVPLARPNAAELEKKTESKYEPIKPVVEVVAIGTHNVLPPQCWDAEGKMLVPLPFTWKKEPRIPTTADELWRRVVIRIDGQIKNSPEDLVWEVVGATSFSGGTVEFKGGDFEKGSEPGTYFARAYRLDDATKSFDLRVGIAQGPWKTVARRMTMTPLPSANSIIFSDPISTAQGVDVIVSHTVNEEAYRVVAVDKEGTEHKSVRSGGSSAGGIAQTRASFPRLAPENLDHFEFQTREYEWTEFKNLPVEPGEKSAKSDASSPGLVEEFDNFAQLPDAGIVAVAPADAKGRFTWLDDAQDLHVYRITSKDKFWRAIERRVDSAFGHEGAFADIVQDYAAGRSDGPQVDFEELLRNSCGEWLFLQKRKNLLWGCELTNPKAVEASLDRIAAVIADYFEVSRIGDTKVWLYSASDEFIAAVCVWQNKLIIATHLTLLEQVLLADNEQKREMRIKVVDADGKPLEGAWLFRNLTFTDDETKRSKIENETYYSDRNGEATVALASETINLHLWVKKEDHVPLVVSWRDIPSEHGDQLPETFEVRMKRGTQIGGVVTNVAGIPIAGAKVEIVAESAKLSDSDKPLPGKRPGISGWLAYGTAGVLTDAEGRWSLGNVPTDEELVLSEEEGKDPHNTPLRLRFTHPDYETIDGIKDWQSVWNPAVEQLRDGTAQTVMKWVDRDNRGRANAVRLEDGKQYKNADFSGRTFKGQQIIVWNDDMFVAANLAGSAWEDTMIPGMARLLYEADLSGAKLIGASFTGQASGLQRTNFSRAELESAVLMGGVAGLQEANFEQATITNSDLTGGVSAMQGASFQGATLHSSRLKAEGAALQGANFDDAKLVKTTIDCDSPTAFQGVSLNNTEFVERDLSSIDAEALASCTFDESTSPRYDAKTKFPKGFDPDKRGWISEP